MTAREEKEGKVKEGKEKEIRIKLKNLIELNDNLDSFAEEDALWLASWIEYLGDEETADRIRKTPGEFKEIIAVRYEELREFTNK